jgi:hypothetical protein
VKHNRCTAAFNVRTVSIDTAVADGTLLTPDGSNPAAHELRELEAAVQHAFVAAIQGAIVALPDGCDRLAERFSGMRLVGLEDLPGAMPDSFAVELAAVAPHDHDLLIVVKLESRAHGRVVRIMPTAPLDPYAVSGREIEQLLECLLRAGAAVEVEAQPDVDGPLRALLGAPDASPGIWVGIHGISQLIGRARVSARAADFVMPDCVAKKAPALAGAVVASMSPHRRAGRLEIDFAMHVVTRDDRFDVRFTTTSRVRAGTELPLYRFTGVEQVRVPGVTAS